MDKEQRAAKREQAREQARATSPFVKGIFITLIFILVGVFYIAMLLSQLTYNGTL